MGATKKGNLLKSLFLNKIYKKFDRIKKMVFY